jgi:hypothetical protein
VKGLPEHINEDQITVGERVPTFHVEILILNPGSDVASCI